MGIQGLSVERVPRPALYLGAGALVALLLQFFSCGLVNLGTHLLAHEAGGHAVTAWLMGRFSIPAVYFTTWSEPSRFVEGLILVALAGGAYKAWKEERRHLAIGLGVGAAVYPLVAFTAANEALCLAGGHLGEIGWSAFFFYRATRGGWFQDQERPLYATLAWYLWLGNVILFFGLATSDAKRVAYESISLVDAPNDFIRVAQLLGTKLARVSAVMLLLAVVVPPAGAALGWWRSAAAEPRAA